MICAQCDAPTDSDPCAGCGASPLLEGRYRLLEVCGRGANGTTWRAETLDGEPVALKELTYSARSGVQESFDREVNVLRQLDHPAIPKLIEVFSTGSGRARNLWVAQTFFEGPTLAAYMEDHRFSEDEVFAYAQEIAGILEYLHGLSPPVIHRDLKPENLIVRPDGSLGLVDFGSVRDTVQDSLLGGNTVAGSFGYMAPEQFRGDAWPQSDFYGLGALMASLLTRKPAASLLGDDRRLHWERHARPSPAMRATVNALLSPVVDDRPASAAAIVQLRERGFAEAEAQPGAELFEPQQAAQLPEVHTSRSLVSAHAHPPTRHGGEGGSSVVFAALAALVLIITLSIGATIVITGMALVTLDEPGSEPVDLREAARTRLVPNQLVTPERPNVPPVGFVRNRSGHDLFIRSIGPIPLAVPAGRVNVVTVPSEQHTLLGMRRIIDTGAGANKPSPPGRNITDELSPGVILSCDADACVNEAFKTVEQGEIEFETRVGPRYPDGISPREERCVLDLWIDRSGEVLYTKANECSDGFASAAEAALSQWKAKPDGDPRRTTIAVVFKPQPKE